MNASGVKDATKKNYYILADSKITSFFHDIYATEEMHNPAKGNN